MCRHCFKFERVEIMEKFFYFGKKNCIVVDATTGRILRIVEKDSTHSETNFGFNRHLAKSALTMKLFRVINYTSMMEVLNESERERVRNLMAWYVSL